MQKESVNSCFFQVILSCSAQREEIQSRCWDQTIKIHLGSAELLPFSSVTLLCLQHLPLLSHSLPSFYHGNVPKGHFVPVTSTLSAQGLLGKSRAALLMIMLSCECPTCSPLPLPWVSKAEAKQGSKTGVSCCSITSGPQANTIQLSPRRENWHLWAGGSSDWCTPGTPEQILHSIPLHTDSQMLPRSEKLTCNLHTFGRHY